MAAPIVDRQRRFGRASEVYERDLCTHDGGPRAHIVVTGVAALERLRTDLRATSRAEAAPSNPQKRSRKPRYSPACSAVTETATRVRSSIASRALTDWKCVPPLASASIMLSTAPLTSRILFARSASRVRSGCAFSSPAWFTLVITPARRCESACRLRICSSTQSSIRPSCTSRTEHSFHPRLKVLVQRYRGMCRPVSSRRSGRSSLSLVRTRRTREGQREETAARSWCAAAFGWEPRPVPLATSPSPTRAVLCHGCGAPR